MEYESEQISEDTEITVLSSEVETGQLNGYRPLRVLNMVVAVVAFGCALVYVLFGFLVTQSHSSSVFDAAMLFAFGALGVAYYNLHIAKQLLHANVPFIWFSAPYIITAIALIAAFNS